MATSRLSSKWQTWILVTFIIFLLIFFYFIRAVIGPFVVSLILVYLLAPIVDFITTLKLPKCHNFSRGFGVLVIYLFIIFSLFFIGELVIPRLYDELVRMARDLPIQFKAFRTDTLSNLISSLQGILNQNELKLNLNQHLNDSIGSMLKFSEAKIGDIPQLIPKLIGAVFNALTTFLIIFIFTAFVLLDLPKIQRNLANILPIQWKDEASKLMRAINRDLGGTIRGQLLICLVNGVLTTIGLLVLHIKYAFTIGIIAGVFSIIPVFGAVISSIPALIISLTQSWVVALEVLGVIIAIHLIEANVLNPKIMGHTVELHPSIIIFALIVGEHFFGIAGLLLSVPVAAMIRSVVSHFYCKFFYLETEKPSKVKV